MYVEIKKLSNGSHIFQDGGPLFDGWAIVPENIQIPDTFPYVNIEVEQVERNGKKYMEVISMTAGERLVEETVETPTQLDRIEAQVTYTAMLTNTLLEE